MASADPEPRKEVIDGVTYHLLKAPASSVRLIWKNGEGKQLRSFPEAAGFIKSIGETPVMVMNGGIFEPGGIPSGLLIQDSKELRPINRAKGNGNFFLQPNGVFYIGNKGAAVIRTDEYPPRDVEIQQAVQSGPLLLRDGKVHPAFNKGSNSRLHRNGVGVSKKGEVVFAMSDFRSPKYPNLYEFAELFRDLGCDDALFLDGDISQMRFGDDASRFSNDFGSFIAVLKMTEEEK